MTGTVGDAARVWLGCAGWAGVGASRSAGAATARSSHGGLGWEWVYDADSKGGKGGIGRDAHHGADGALGEAGEVAVV